MAKTDNLTDFLTNTADAIRTAEGSTDVINPQDFEAKIKALKLSVQTADANATATDILSGKTAWVNGTKISGSIGTKAATTIIPGTLDQTIDSGVYLAGAQTIKGDSNLTADNIKSGTSIFGVTGIYEGSGGSGGSENESCVVRFKCRLNRGGSISYVKFENGTITPTILYSAGTMALNQYMSFNVLKNSLFCLCNTTTTFTTEGNVVSGTTNKDGYVPFWITGDCTISFS